MAADIRSIDTSANDEAVLVSRARSGDPAAFDELYRREAPAAWRLAMAVTRSSAPAATAVARGFAKVLGSDAGRSRGAISPALLAATRSAAIDLHAPAEPPHVNTPSSALTLRAFHGLPERSRSILWLTGGEGLDAATAGEVMGIGAEAASDLTRRAHDGLRERFVAAHLAAAGTDECKRIATRLDDYASERLSTREAGKVRRHLDGCDPCQARLTELDDLMPRLRRSAAPPVPASLADQARVAWTDAHVAVAGPLHLTLPNGRPMPPWAERAAAGAVAAVIALGITGAIIAGGRSRPGDDRLAKQASSSEPGGADGESALGDIGDPPLTLPDGGPVPSLGGSTGNGAGAGGAAPVEQARVLGSSRSPSSTTTPTPTTAPDDGSTPPSEPAPTPPPTAPDAPPPSEPSVPPAPSPADPIVETLTDTVDQVVDTLDEVVDTLVGGGDASTSTDTTLLPPLGL